MALIRLAGCVIIMLGGMEARAQAPPGLPRLTGIVITGRQRVAIFEGQPGLAVSVEEGETIAAYTVRAIAPGGVQVERDGRSFALSLTHTTQAAAPADNGGGTFGQVVNPQAEPDD